MIVLIASILFRGQEKSNKVHKECHAIEHHGGSTE
jgi:hypothetical protein